MPSWPNPGSNENKAFLNRWRSPRVSASLSRICRLQEGPLASCLDHEPLMNGLGFLTCLHLVISRKFHCQKLCVSAQSLQLCLTLCDPPGSSVHGDSPGKNTGAGYHALLQGIFPTQGLNLSLLHLGIAGGFFTHRTTLGSPQLCIVSINSLTGVQVEDINLHVIFNIVLLFYLVYMY